MRNRFCTGLLLLLAQASFSSALKEQATSNQVRAEQGINPGLRQTVNVIEHSKSVAETFKAAAVWMGVRTSDLEKAAMMDQLEIMNAKFLVQDADLSFVKVWAERHKTAKIQERWVALHKALRSKKGADPDRLDPQSEYDAMEQESIEINNERLAQSVESAKVLESLKKPKAEIQALDKEILALRRKMMQAGIKLEARPKPANWKILDSLPEVVVKSKGMKLFLGTTLVTVLGAAAVLTYFLLEKYAPFILHDTPVTTQQRFEIIRKQSKPEDMIKERCAAMHNSVSQLEQIAQESSSAMVWKDHLDFIGPIYRAAYVETNAAGIKEINGREIINWGAPAPSPIASSIPVNASVSQRQYVEESNAQAEEHWSFNEFLRPISLQFKLAEEHRDRIHETALTIIRNSTASRFATDTDRFNQVYAAYFGRMDIPGGCFKYIKEPKSIHMQYKDAREEQASYEMDTRVALEYNFAARSALPVTPPLPAVLLPGELLRGARR